MCAVLPEVGLGLTYIWTATRRIWTSEYNNLCEASTSLGTWSLF
jgi:hypothetical protein